MTQPARPNARRVPLGRPLIYTDEDLAFLAALSAADAPAILAFARRASPRLAALLDAPEEDRTLSPAYPPKRKTPHPHSPQVQV